MTDRPFAPSAARNAPAILAALHDTLSSLTTVLEVGSGTGQHAVHFCAALPHLRWQPSDQREQLPGIQAWREDAALENVLPALALEVGRDPWPTGPFDGIYTANTLHYMPWHAVKALFAAAPAVLAPEGVLMVYGPFRVGGAWVSPNDEAFDARPREGAAFRGLRDLEAVEALAQAAGLRRCGLHAMPADNRVVLWRRS